MIADLIPLTPAEIKVTRFTKGRLIGGKLEASAQRPFVLQAAAQPLTGRERETLPEGRRQIKTLKLYTDIPLLVSNDKLNQRADLVEVECEDYEVFEIHKQRGIGLDHYKVFIAKLNKE